MAGWPAQRHCRKKNFLSPRAQATGENCWRKRKHVITCLASIGGHYLADLLPLVPTLATSPREADAFAMMSRFSPEPGVPPAHPIVYTIAADGVGLQVTE